MAKDKKLVEAITSMEDDFAKWYTDVVKKADLMDYTSVKGCMVFKPAGYALWENIQHELDRRFKETGVENVYLPMFIPESLLQKEKDHVEGFAPEVAWVTHGGLEELPERMCVRPHLKHCFAIFMLRKSSLTEICLRSTISGAQLSAGRKRPVLSSAPESFYGRKAILPMPQLRKLRRERSRCSTCMQTSVRKFWQSL